MFDIQERNGYKIIHLTDGDLLPQAVAFIEKGKADGVNLNYIRNWRTDLEPLRDLQTIKCLIVNDYPPSMNYDYSSIHSLKQLTHLSINTNDKKEIDFSIFPHLKSVTLAWRPKAKTLFDCFQLRDLFLGRYTEKDLSEVGRLKNLKYLRINTGSITSLNGISQIIGLEELWLMQATKLEDINDMLTLRNIKRLRIDNCKRVKNIDSVKMMGIPQLELVGTTPK